MSDLFSKPIKIKKVRKDLYAYQYLNGCINIDGIKYYGYSITDAISRYRKKYPAR